MEPPRSRPSVARGLSVAETAFLMRQAVTPPREELKPDTPLYTRDGRTVRLFDFAVDYLRGLAQQRKRYAARRYTGGDAEEAAGAAEEEEEEEDEEADGGSPVAASGAAARGGAGSGVAVRWSGK